MGVKLCLANRLIV